MRKTLKLSALLAGAALLPACLSGLQIPQQNSKNDASAFAGKIKIRSVPVDANVVSTPESLSADASRRANPAVAAMVKAWADAPAALGQRARVYIDLRTGLPLGVQPDGLPWIPGTGINNHLTVADMARFGASTTLKDADRNGINDAVLERIARSFMNQHPAWFPIAQSHLQLHPYGPVADDYFARPVIFDQVVNGVPVENAVLMFNLNHGNLVSFGGQNLAPVNISTTPALLPNFVEELVFRYAGIQNPADVTDRSYPRLKIIIDNDSGAVPGGGFTHRLVYEMAFRLNPEGETWLAEVDASSGEVLGFHDTNLYGRVVGGVQPLSNDGSCPTGCEQAGWPMPFTDVGGGLFADTGGNYSAVSGTITTTLNGKTVKPVNSTAAGACTVVSPSESVTAPATLDMGFSGGTDCTVPAGKSAGNTHAARTAYYNVTKTKAEVRGWSPSATLNTFLDAQVTVNVNINAQCNANWNGTLLNMFKSSPNCANTGEIAMIFDHEIGHGMDQNDGGPGGLSIPSEAYADHTAFLHHHDSCIGRGFFIDGTKASGYGDQGLTCTGVRDADWTKHKSLAPHTLTMINGNDVPATNSYGCANIAQNCGTAGPCGKECHCEAVPMTESIWDAANIDLPHNPIPANGGSCVGTAPPLSQAAAWTLASRIWWKSVGALGTQYACVANTGGCGVATTFHLMKVQDDDDGSLANGTPHASELQCAFGRHQLGCTTDTNTSTTSCPAIGSTTVTATPSAGQIALTWPTTAGVNQWRVLRNEESCGSGYTVLATLSAATLNYTDTGLQSGRSYYYEVQALGTNAACEGAPSACVNTRPNCYATPVLTGATASASNQVTLTFTNGAPAAPDFKIYRDRNTCAAANFTGNSNFNIAPYASGVTASPYLDASVQGGGFVYAYSVSGTDANNYCETLKSNCLQVTATGPCIIPPNFAGATSGANAGQTSCTNTVTWAAGTPGACGGTVSTYNVYRSTSSGFTPAAGNRIAQGVSGTSYSDANGLTSGTPYYYVVRALDSLGNEDTNTIQVSATPTGFTAPATFTDTFEGALSGGGFDKAGWTHGIINGATNFVSSTLRNQTPTHSWYGLEVTTPSDKVVTTPALKITSPSTLSFYHGYAFEGTVAQCYDGATLEVSTNGGTSWTTMPGASFTAGGFNGTCGNFSNPIGTKPCWCTTLAGMNLVTVNLAAYNGLVTQLRWHEGDDVSAASAAANPGYYLDSVSITNAGTQNACTTCSVTPMSNVVQSKASPNLVGTWPAVAGAATYNVYRNTTPATPASWSSIQTGLVSPTFSDAGQLTLLTSAFYTVTDVNTCSLESTK